MASFLEEAECLNLTNFGTSGSFSQISDDHRQRLTVKSQATIYGGRFWGMSHQFKLGLAIENEYGVDKIGTRKAGFGNQAPKAGRAAPAAQADIRELSGPGYTHSNTILTDNFLFSLYLGRVSMPWTVFS